MSKLKLNDISVEEASAFKTINLAIFGHGLVGGTLVNQIIASANTIETKQAKRFNIFCVANSKHVLLDKNGISEGWEEAILTIDKKYTIQDVISYAKTHHLDNLIAVDNTASKDFVVNYIPLVEEGFHLVSSNKIANTLDLEFYNDLRNNLKKYQKQYLYETNVGAGLPLIDTIKLLHLSGENITRIRGVFSGSLSYVFNTFSVEDKPFGEVLQTAINNGYTEPDPREDLCGNDVARKLLILARELELYNEFEDVKIQNLIPEALRNVTALEFLKSLDKLNENYKTIKTNQESGHVLRYTGDLYGDLSDHYGGILEVKLVSVPEGSLLGSLKGSDSIFEIYTESYGEQPLIVQGAGAGAKVTARGVFGDILRVTQKNN